jgi:hypothetical protein
MSEKEPTIDDKIVTVRDTRMVAWIGRMSAFCAACQGSVPIESV